MSQLKTIVYSLATPILSVIIVFSNGTMDLVYPSSIQFTLSLCSSMKDAVFRKTEGIFRMPTVFRRKKKMSV